MISVGVKAAKLGCTTSILKVDWSVGGGWRLWWSGESPCSLVGGVWAIVGMLREGLVGYGGCAGVVFTMSSYCGTSEGVHFIKKNRGMRSLRTVRLPTGGDVASRLGLRAALGLLYYLVLIYKPLFGGWFGVWGCSPFLPPDNLWYQDTKGYLLQSLCTCGKEGKVKGVWGLSVKGYV